MFSPWELLIVLMEFSLLVIVLALPVVLAIKCFRLMRRNKNENIKLRLEVGKLANELEQVRKQKDTENGDSSSVSR